MSGIPNDAPTEVDRVLADFRSAYGAMPTVVASAPGRVNLIGEHIDYNGGSVLPIAIAGRTWVAMAPSPGSASRAVSVGRPPATFHIDSPNAQQLWVDYIHGALREVVRSPTSPTAVNVAVRSTVPVGAGLSSSAAIEVASALAGVVVSGGSVVDAWDKLAGAAHRAETKFVGVPCGTMDQTASAYCSEGHALHLRCDSGKIAQLPFASSVLVVDSATPRALRVSDYAARQASCERVLKALRVIAPIDHLAHATLDQLECARHTVEASDFKRARHVVTEQQRVADFVDALAQGAPLGALVNASHDSLRDDYECSTAELDWLVDFARSYPSIAGARLTGAGWGGCMIALGPTQALAALALEIVPRFRERWGREPHTYHTTASEGVDIDWLERRST